MKQASRAAVILKDLLQAGSASVDPLSEKLGVSLATIRRELQELEERGLLRLTHGGAIPIEPLFYEAFATPNPLYGPQTPISSWVKSTGFLNEFLTQDTSNTSNLGSIPTLIGKDKNVKLTKTKME